MVFNRQPSFYGASALHANDTHVYRIHASAYGIQTPQLLPITIARGTERRVGFLLAVRICSPASAAGRTSTDTARNRLGSMSPSCAGDSMPGSFYFTVSSRLPFYAFHRVENREKREALGHVYNALRRTFAHDSSRTRQSIDKGRFPMQEFEARPTFVSDG